MLKWLMERIKNIILCPVNWFWEQYNKYKENENYLKIIGLFSISVGSLLSIVVALAYLLSIPVTYLISHPEWIFVGFLIYLLYSYGKSQSIANQEHNKQQQVIIEEADQVALEDNASRGYEPICTFMFQVLREVAEEANLKLPALIGDIEMPVNKYDVINGITYYYFVCYKKTIELLDDNEIEIMERQITSAISRKLKSQANSSMILESYKDENGTFYNGVCLDSVEDMGTYIKLTVVPMTPQYALLLRNQKQRALMRSDAKSDFSTSWDDQL